MKLQQAVLDSLFLFNQSEDHRLYTLVEFNHYCLFPLLNNKARLFYDGDRPVGFVSWAWLTKEEADQFLGEQWLLGEEVHKRPDVVDARYQLWGIDFITPYGHSTQVMRKMISHAHLLYNQRVKVHWRRLKQPEKIHIKEFRNGRR